MTKSIILITSGLFLLVLLFYFVIEKNLRPPGVEIPVMETWELPDILKEISGIAYLGNKQIACIQDENGIIFIYDLENRKIVRQIDFAGDGDYESISLAGNTAYVLRSDGTIYEINNFLADSPEIRIIYSFEVPGKNFEGLEYDERNNRLLLSIKERSGREYRPVYSLDLGSGELKEDPVFRIAFSDPIFSELGKKASEKFLRPSEISIHPATGKIYILEGINPKILILDEKGTPEKIHLLSRKQFRQAEGLTFGENGEIYVSNEGNGTAPNILQISLN